MEENKNYIAELILKNIDLEINLNDILEKIEVPKEKSNGDFAFPCFFLSKVLKKSPVIIANELKEKLDGDNKFSKIDSVNGYLNFYLNSENVVNEILMEILDKKEKYGFTDLGHGRNVVVDYSSPNIAKPFHLGHFRTTIIGRALCNLYKELGYNIVGVNHLGDWGRQFGLLIEAYKLYKDEYDIENNPLKALADMYVRITKLSHDDESVMDKARENFKKLEEGDEEYLKLWKYFRDISLKEYERIYKFMGCNFDSYNGEAFYNDKMDEIVDILDKKGVLVESQGARVVEMGEGKPPCIIIKSDGTTIYATRDLAAVLYRVRNYDFAKCIYVTSYEQIDHFKQVFEVAKYIVDEKYQKELVHVPYGMVRLKTGKMSTREGNVIYLQDLIDEAIKKAMGIIEEKNANLKNKAYVAKCVGLGALVFNDLKHSKIKDVVFDLDEVVRFDGETGPYIEYTYVRINSLLKKSGIDFNNIIVNSIDLSVLKSDYEIELIKELAKFGNIIKKAADEYEPSILARYLIDVASMYSRFYNECTVIVDDEKLKIARLALCFSCGIVIKKGLEILGISCPDEM